MSVSVSVKSTLVYASFDDAASAGLRPSSSCSSLAAAGASPREKADGADVGLPLASLGPYQTLSQLGTWADVDSDFDEGEPPPCLPPVELGALLFPGGARELSKAGETLPAAREAAPAQLPESARTPLSSRASAFSSPADGPARHVPLTPACPLSSRASAFVPRSSQVARAPAWAVESEGGPVLGAPSQALAQSPAVTTAMLRNLPCDFTRSDLLDILDREGFAGLYDFVYVPIDFKRKLCKGYSFVNMVAAEHLQRLVKVFNGYNGWSGSSTKVCQASMSHTQGLTANIERYRNSPVLCDAVPDIFKPALFMGKRQVPFPEPTRKFSQVIQHF